MDIQNIVIAGHNINLIKAMHDYHTRHYMWEVAKVLVPVFITGFITVFVMRINDNRNKKRWLNDSFIKHQNDLIIKVNTLLIEFTNKFNKHFDVQNTISIDIGLVSLIFDKFEAELEELRFLYYQLYEVYKIKVTSLIDVFSQLNFVKKYVNDNLDLNSDKTTISLTNMEQEIELKDYMSLISSELSKSKEAMIKVIQKKLK